MRLVGHAAVFNELTYIDGYHEKIRPGAFARALRSDKEIHAVFHHDWRIVLGSTKNGSLRLHEDAKGLAIEVDLPDTGPASDLYKLVKRGDIGGMSFQFSLPNAASEIWRETSKGLERELLDLNLYEVTVTPRPAYKSTDVFARAAEPTSPKARTLKRKLAADLAARVPC